MAYQLPTLPYAFDALEPYIDTTTMQIHHGKHHAAYVANLNKAIDGTPFESVAARRTAGQAGHRAGEHPHRGPQQRRRAHQPQPLLDDPGAERGRRPLARRLAQLAAAIDKRSAASTSRRRS